jgi:hypothetical protein
MKNKINLPTKPTVEFKIDLPDDWSVATIRSSILIPEDFKEKGKLSLQYGTASSVGAVASAILYCAMCDQAGEAETDKWFLTNSNVTIGFLWSLRAVGEERLLPELLHTAGMPIYQRAIQMGANLETQRYLVNQKSLLAPVKVKSGKTSEYKVMPVPKNEITMPQARQLFRSAKLEQDEKILKNIADEAAKARMVPHSQRWECKGNVLHIYEPCAFDRKRFEEMALVFYRHLRDPSGLEAILKKAQIEKPSKKNAA